jgi:hypothetical protein
MTLIFPISRDLAPVPNHAPTALIGKLFKISSRTTEPEDFRFI